MRLAKVEYEFFDYEEASAEVAELDRQVRLHFSDAPSLFVSWTWERQHTSEDQPYSIGSNPVSHWDDEPAAVVDASRSGLWAQHLGREVTLTFVPAASPELEYQVLEVRSEGGAIFLYSLGLDVVGLSGHMPSSTTVSGGEPRE